VFRARVGSASHRAGRSPLLCERSGRVGLEAIGLLTPGTTASSASSRGAPAQHSVERALSVFAYSPDASAGAEAEHAPGLPRAMPTCWPDVYSRGAGKSLVWWVFESAHRSGDNADDRAREGPHHVVAMTRFKYQLHWASS
jgi:hypothetical protein